MKIKLERSSLTIGNEDFVMEKQPFFAGIFKKPFIYQFGNNSKNFLLGKNGEFLVNEKLQCYVTHGYKKSGIFSNAGLFFRAESTTTVLETKFEENSDEEILVFSNNDPIGNIKIQSTREYELDLQKESFESFPEVLGLLLYIRNFFENLQFAD